MMKRLLCAAAVVGLTLAAPMAASKDGQILHFTTMVGVDGIFVNQNPIRNILGDELPWEIKKATGTLMSDGRLNLNIKGLVFANDPNVPPNLVGRNDEANFRAVVSCLSDDGAGGLTTVNVFTGGFKATPTGNCNIHAKVILPQPCVAPLVLILAGSEDLWFAVTGLEGT